MPMRKDEIPGFIIAQSGYLVPVEFSNIIMPLSSWKVMLSTAWRFEVLPAGVDFVLEPWVQLAVSWDDGRFIL